jgi:hypothetical protein
MVRFRRQGASGEDRGSEPHVASDLAEFLAHATEGQALMQAIGEAQSPPDTPTVAATSSDVPPRGPEDEG